jgi:hypothetical protein
MRHVIVELLAADIDRLEALWQELLEHHLAAVPHLAALGTARDLADSWCVRRTQHLKWLAVPLDRLGLGFGS